MPDEERTGQGGMPGGGGAGRGEGDPDRVRAGASESEGVLTIVCLKCGMEYYLTNSTPDSGISCEKCGNSVFREFYTNEGDEAAADFRDSTGRELAPDDAEGDVLPGDVLDLNRD